MYKWTCRVESHVQGLTYRKTITTPFFIISMNPHLTLAYESLKQCQVIQFVINTMKFHETIKMKESKIKVRFCGSGTGLCGSIMD